MPPKQNITDKIREMITTKTQYAVDLLFVGKYDKAIKEVDEVLSYDPTYTRALNVKAIASASLGRFEEGIEIAQKSIAIDENDGISHSILGICYSRANRFEEAETALQKGMEVSPDDFIPFYNAACHYARAGNLEASVRCLKTAYEIAPKNVPGLIEKDIELEPLRGTPYIQKFFEEIGNT